MEVPYGFGLGLFRVPRQWAYMRDPELTGEERMLTFIQSCRLDSVELGIYNGNVVWWFRHQVEAGPLALYTLLSRKVRDR